VAILIVAGAALIPSLQGVAQTQAPGGFVIGGDAYSTRVWDTDDGLPSNTVSALAQTPDGYLWIGAAGGLLRFDGNRLVRIDVGRADAGSASFSDLVVDASGALWGVLYYAKTGHYELVRRVGGAWEVVMGFTGEPGEAPRDLATGPLHWPPSCPAESAVARPKEGQMATCQRQSVVWRYKDETLRPRSERGNSVTVKMKLLASTAVAICAIGLATPAFGQDQQAAADLAKQAQNPIANMISLPFQHNINSGVGPLDRNQNTLVGRRKTAQRRKT